MNILSKQNFTFKILEKNPGSVHLDNFEMWIPNKPCMGTFIKWAK